MNRLFVIAGLAILVAALVFLNQGIKKSAPPEHEDEPAAQAQKTPPSTPVDPRAFFAAEETVGNPATAQHHITMGWVYSEANFQHPEGLAVPIQAVRDVVSRSNGMASAEIVNLDVPVEDRSAAARAVTDLGVSVDGKTLFSSNPGETPAPADSIMQQIVQVMQKK